MRSSVCRARFAALLGVVASCCAASESRAAFSATATRTSAGANVDVLLLRAINDGVGGTGTNLSAIDLGFSLFSGASGSHRAYFFVDDTDLDGTPDQVQITNPGNSSPTGVPANTATGGSFVRVGTASDTFVVSTLPSKNVVQPNPWIAGVTGFAITATALNSASATGTGALFARLFVDKDAGVFVSGTIGGNTGSGQPFTFVVDAVGGNANHPPVFGEATLAAPSSRYALTNNADHSLYTLTIDFTKAGPANFSIDFAASDVDLGQTLTLTPAAAPAGVTLGATGLNLAGTVDPSLRATLDLPLTLSDSFVPAGVDNAVLRIVAVPEPAVLAMTVAGFGFALRRHCRFPE